MSGMKVIQTLTFHPTGRSTLNMPVGSRILSVVASDHQGLISFERDAKETDMCEVVIVSREGGVPFETTTTYWWLGTITFRTEQGMTLRHVYMKGIKNSGVLKRV